MMLANDLKTYYDEVRRYLDCPKDEQDCSATRFLRNSDRIHEKKAPVLRSISEPRSLASAAHKIDGAAHARGRVF